MKSVRYIYLKKNTQSIVLWSCWVDQIKRITRTIDKVSKLWWNSYNKQYLIYHRTETSHVARAVREVDMNQVVLRFEMSLLLIWSDTLIIGNQYLDISMESSDIMMTRTHKELEITFELTSSCYSVMKSDTFFNLVMVKSWSIKGK